MPTGLLVMHWDKRVGADVLAQFPNELNIQEKTLMQIYSQHQYTDEAGVITLTSGGMNLVSYFTGSETSIFIILTLNLDEDGTAFEEALAESATLILDNQEEGKLKNIISSLFQRLSVFPSLTVEQKYADIYLNKAKKMIVDRLREDIAIPKSELTIWFKDQYKEGFLDVDNIIKSVVKAGLIRVVSVKELSADMVFLVGDYMIMRVPPKDLLKDPVDHHLPSKFKGEYIKETKEFFKSYTPSEADNLMICEKILGDAQAYEVLKLMREACVTRNDLEKLRKKGVEDLDAVLKKFWEAKMIAVFRDEDKSEYYGLTSDFAIKKFYPQYLLNAIIAKYKKKEQNNLVLLQALEIIRDEYMDLLEKA